MRKGKKNHHFENLNICYNQLTLFRVTLPQNLLFSRYKFLFTGAIAAEQNDVYHLYTLNW